MAGTLDLLLELMRPVGRGLPCALRDLGYVEGRNLEVVYRWAADKEERLPALAARLVQAGVEVVAELAARHRFPLMYEAAAYVDAGGLIAYGPDGRALTRRSAVFVEKILKRAKAGDLPIEQPITYQLAIKLKAAQALGLAIPQSFLMRADAIRR